MIILNAAICKKCNTFIASLHTHDFRLCKCGSIAVDGGKEYLKRTGDLNLIKSCVVTYKSEDQEFKVPDYFYGDKG